MLLALAACFAHPHRQGNENSPAASASATPSPATSRPKDAIPPVPPSQPTPKDEDYAPASHMNNENSSDNGLYGPATHIGEASKAPTVKVALLIPMSGDSAALGQSLMDAAVLAIYDKYAAMSSHDITARVELLPKDTGDTIEGAEKAAQDAIQEGATLILGPVFGKQVSAVASYARHKNIPVISFSNNTAVAGDGVYLFGFIPEQQVDRIVQYAVSRKINNIAALVPSNPYGAAIVKQLSAVVRKGGGPILSNIIRRIYRPSTITSGDFHASCRMKQEKGRRCLSPKAAANSKP